MAAEPHERPRRAAPRPAARRPRDRAPRRAARDILRRTASLRGARALRGHRNQRGTAWLCAPVRNPELDWHAADAASMLELGHALRRTSPNRRRHDSSWRASPLTSSSPPATASSWARRRSCPGSTRPPIHTTGRRPNAHSTVPDLTGCAASSEGVAHSLRASSACARAAQQCWSAASASVARWPSRRRAPGPSRTTRAAGGLERAGAPPTLARSLGPATTSSTNAIVTRPRRAFRSRLQLVRSRRAAGRHSALHLGESEHGARCRLDPGPWRPLGLAPSCWRERGVRSLAGRVLLSPQRGHRDPDPRSLARPEGGHHPRTMTALV